MKEIQSEYLAPGVYIEERPGQRSIEDSLPAQRRSSARPSEGPCRGRRTSSPAWGISSARSGASPIVPDPADLGEHGHLPFAVKQYFDNGGQILFIARAYKPQGAGITDAKNYRMLQLASGSAARLRATAPKGTTYAFITASRGFVQGTSLLVRDTLAGSPSTAITASTTER